MRRLITAIVVDECELLAIHNTFWTRVKTSLFLCWIHRETQCLGHMLLHLNTSNTVVNPNYEWWRHRWSGGNTKGVQSYFFFRTAKSGSSRQSFRLFATIRHVNCWLTLILSHWNRIHHHWESDITDKGISGTRQDLIKNPLRFKNETAASFSYGCLQNTKTSSQVSLHDLPNYTKRLITV